MKPSVQTLGQVLYSPSQYIIPVFQRNYRWERPQWEKLWESVLDIRAPGKVGNHFMGFLVFVPGLAQPGQHTQFHLIDGQQRMTSCSLLLAAIRNVARELQDEELADEVHNYFLVHPLKRGHQRYRVLPKSTDQQNFITLIDGVDEVTGRMADAVDFFEQHLKVFCAAVPSRLREVFNAASQRLEFMCATLEAENAYNIFKSLNSIGVPLGASDLIRNFMFMHIAPDDHDDFDNRHWSKLEALFTDRRGAIDEEQFSRFFRDFLMIDGRYVQPKETFAIFEARYEATGFPPIGLAEDLLLAANDYDVISGDKKDGDEIVTTELFALNQLESSTTYPLLLALFRLRREGRLQSIQLAECLRMLCGFIFRRFIASESSRGYGPVFVRAIPRVMKSSPVDELKQYLLERGWPDDVRFEGAFAAFPLYQRGYTKECLATIETASRHKEPADLSNVQVEHIMPQTLTDHWTRELGDDAKRVHSEWLHRPGNLTLSAYNPELGNQPFSTKRVRFEQSNVGLTRDLGRFTKWTENEIRSRGEMLARRAKDIWIGPAEPFVAETDTAGPAADITARDLRLHFWTGLSEYLGELDAALPSLEPKPHRSIRLPSIVKNIGVELRYMVQRHEFAIDVFFWRPASHAVWERLKSNPAELNRVTGGEWSFDRGEGLSAWMTLRLEASTTDSASWPAIYEWAGEKLGLLYGQIVPLLREELGSQATAPRSPRAS